MSHQPVDDEPTNAQYDAEIPIQSVEGGAVIDEAPGHDGEHHGPVIYPPRVAWHVHVKDGTREAIIKKIRAGDTRWWNIPAEDVDELIERVQNQDFEFRITAIRPRHVDEDGNPLCKAQPAYPFRQSLEEKARLRREKWFQKMIFDPIPEAFPTAACQAEDCPCTGKHEYKATAEVRLADSSLSGHPGFEVDPHIIFRGDDEHDRRTR